MEYQSTRFLPSMEQTQQKEEQRQFTPCFQELYRKTGDAIEFRYQRISCGSESEPAGNAVAASTQKTTHSSEGVEQRGKEGKKIQELCLARRMEGTSVPGCGQPCPKQSTIVYRAAKTVPKGVTGGVRQQSWQLEQSVEQMSTQQQPCNHSDKGLYGHIRRERAPLS